MTSVAGDRRGRTDPDLLLPIVWVLAAAAAAELVLLRTFSRTALHIPDVEPLQVVYSTGSDVGRYAYFVAVAALLTAGILALRLAWSYQATLRTLPILAIGAFLVSAAFTPGRLAADGVLIALAVAAVFVACLSAGLADRRLAPLVGLVVIAFGATGTWNLLQTTGPVDPTWYGRTAELATVGVAVAAPFAFRISFDRVSVAIGALAAVLLLSYLVRAPSTSGILLLWNAGLGGTLPATAYAVAGGGVGLTLAGLVRTGRSAHAALFILIICAGTTLQNTYQTGLLVCALTLLALLPAGRTFAFSPELAKPRTAPRNSAVPAVSLSK